MRYCGQYICTALTGVRTFMTENLRILKKVRRWRWPPTHEDICLKMEAASLVTTVTMDELMAILYIHIVTSGNRIQSHRNVRNLRQSIKDCRQMENIDNKTEFKPANFDRCRTPDNEIYIESGFRRIYELERSFETNT